MHPSACKATAPSSLPPLMIPLLPALPTNHHGSVPRRRKPFCESSALSASSTTVSSSRRIWCCDCRTYRPAIPYANKVDSKEERRDSCSATEEEEGWRACYGWPRHWRCLGELSAMLADGQGRGGRSGQGFHCANMEPLLDRKP